MKIIFTEDVAPGVEISKVPFGTIVTRANAGNTVYLVASPMDGTGRRVLISLQGGTLKDLPSNTRVLVRQAVLTVGAIVDKVPYEFEE